MKSLFLSILLCILIAGCSTAAGQKQDRKFNRLQEIIADKDSQISRLRETIKDKDEQIKKLEEKLSAFGAF